MHFLALDLGTSFIKGAVLDLDRLEIREIQRIECPRPLASSGPLRIEYNPENFVTITRALLQDLLRKAPGSEGLVISGQMGGLILLGASNVPLSNYLSWQDRRILEPHPSGNGTYFDALLRRLTPTDWSSLGREIRPGTPLGFLFWMAEQQQTFNENTNVATLPDYVVARLCGCPPIAHPTHAVGALNLVTSDWHRELADRLGFGKVHWPRLAEINEPMGELIEHGKRLKCFPPVGDHPCTLAGALLGFDELSLNISTGSQVSMRASSLALGDFQTIPFFDRQYLRRISNLPAGRAITALVRMFGELAELEGHPLRDPWTHIARLADAVEARGLEACVSFFPTPLGSSGSLTNLREENLTVGHVFRAAFENMADNFHRCALRVSPESDWRRIVFSGGLVQKFPVLRRAIEARFNCPSRLCDTSEDVLRGLLAIAMVCAGRNRTLADATKDLRDHALQPA